MYLQGMILIGFVRTAASGKNCKLTPLTAYDVASSPKFWWRSYHWHFLELQLNT